MIPSEIAVTVDDYIPLSFENIGIEYDEILYWRTGNIINSLVEIGIDSNSGIIINMALILTGGLREVFNLSEIKEYSKKHHIKGIPTVDESLLKETVVDYKREIDVIISNDNLVIKLQKEVLPEKFFYFENIKFGVDSKNNLILIVCSGLSEQDVLKIK